MIIAIVAIAKNYAIGKDGKLPWHYPADLKFFKETTTGHAVVMGSHTWKSIGRPLPNRLNIVLSRSAGIDETPNIRLMRSKDEVLAFAQKAETDVFIIGGAGTFETFADTIDRWIVTEVPAEVEGADTFMPPNFLEGFRITKEMDLADGLKVKIFEKAEVI